MLLLYLSLRLPNGSNRQTRSRTNSPSLDRTYEHRSSIVNVSTLLHQAAVSQSTDLSKHLTKLLLFHGLRKIVDNQTGATVPIFTQIRTITAGIGSYNNVGWHRGEGLTTASPFVCPLPNEISECVLTVR